MTDKTTLLAALSRMLPAQFEQVIFHADIPPGTIGVGPQAARALEVIAYFDPIGELSILENAIKTVSPKILQASQTKQQPEESEQQRTSTKANQSRPHKRGRSSSESKDKQRLKPPKVFISYAHKDEEFKDDLVLMLTTLQDENIIDTWQDREIRAGDDWKQEIKTAMEECNLALLLISKHFLASSFIKDEELPRLLQRRKKEGLRVVPIIVRPCVWGKHSILSGIQALPKDGKPVIEFPENDGSRDRIWTEIAHAVEELAKQLTTP